MKPSKRLAAVAAAALAVSGIAVLSGVGATSAQAATQNFNVFSRINNFALANTESQGNKAISLTVTPASVSVSAPIEVQVSSSNLDFANGPAATISGYGTELTAVVAINGVDYQFRGPRHVPSVAPSDNIFNTNWVVSSTAGNSVSSTATVPNTGVDATGQGTVLRSAPASPTTLSAPAAAGVYGLTLKAIILNGISTVPPSSGGTGTLALTDNFDNIFNLDSAGQSGPPASTLVGPNFSFAANTPSSYFAYSPAVNLTVIGPNATIATSTGQNPGVQAVRIPLPTLAGYTDNPTSISLNGTVWGASVVSGGFTAQFCDVTGVTCDVPVGGTVTNTLTTDASGVINGGAVVLNRTSFGAFITAGSRAIKLTQGANVGLVPTLVLTTPTITLSPSSGGPGTVVNASGSNMNPGQTVNVRGFTVAGQIIITWVTSADSPASTGVAAANGNYGPIAFTVNDTNTTNLGAWQGTATTGQSASTARAATAFAVNQDRCVAYTGNLTGGPGCTTKQNVNVSVLQGNLTQRAYTNSTPTVGSINSGAVAPIVGTSNVNSDATTVNLGTITSPLAPATIVGNLNDITVSDNRGGTFGWTLSATMPNFAGVPSGTLANGQLTAAPTCVATTAANAWNYNAVGQTAIAGFDPTLNAPGQTAGAAAQAFSGTVNLCTKSTAVNATTQTTGGVWNVGSPLTLVVPAFQLAAKYTATMTITLA